MTTDWQQLRSELNHDWLKNTYLRQLHAFMIRIEQSRPDLDRIAEFVENDFPAWRKERGKIAELLECAEQALSPATMIDRPPLSRAAELDRAWLRCLIHELWLVRRPVREWCEAARAAFAEADCRFEEACEALDSRHDVNVARLRQSAIVLQAFSTAIQSLVRQISALPHEVQVV